MPKTGIGVTVIRKEAYEKVTGGAKYTADFFSAGVMTARLVTSTCPHGVLRSIDTDEAAGIPGVRAILSPDLARRYACPPVEVSLDTASLDEVVAARDKARSEYRIATETIRTTDTADDLLTRLAYSGADLLAATMDGLESGAIVPQPQTGDATHAAKISTEDARIDWSAPAFAIDRHIRAHTPGPGAWTMLGEDRLKVGPVRVLGDDAEDLPAGHLSVGRSEVHVGTGAGTVALGQIQPPGKKVMNAADWARGNAALQAGEQVNFS